jgi:hypothetical protein
VVSHTEGNGSGRRTTITQEQYFERLEKGFPGISQNLNAFLDSIPPYNVSPEFGAETMIPDNGKSWNLGTIAKHAEVWMDYLGQQAKSAGLPDLHKQYINRLADLVPGAYIYKTRKETAWNIARDGRSITADALVADQARRDGWARAIREFDCHKHRRTCGPQPEHSNLRLPRLRRTHNSRILFFS